MERETLDNDRVRYAVALTVIAFVLHYAWEHLQCPLFVHRKDDGAMWLAMVLATVGDVVITWIVQVAVAAFSRRWLWPRGAGLTAWGLLFLMAVVIAVFIEEYALATGRWGYAVTNPQIPGLGVSLLPVAQLLVLLPTSFLVADRYAHSQFLRGTVRTRCPRVAPRAGGTSDASSRPKGFCGGRRVSRRIDPS